MTTRQTIAPIRKWHEYTDDEFALFDALDALTTYAAARRAWEHADAGGDFETFSHAESVMRKCSSVLIEIERERNRLRAELAAAPRWVPVTERLPRPRDAEDFFLARLENGTRVEAMHNGSSWWEFDHELEDWIPLVGVTHWYQVPAPEVKP